VALMFGLRIQGITDHAGRQDPPFAHAVAAIDRQLDRSELLAAAGVFHRHVLAVAQSAEWYRSYVRCAAEAPEGMTAVLEEYVAGFSDLPSPPQSAMGLKWTVGESTPPARIVIVHDDDAPFGLIAECAAKIAAVLFPSDIRWSAISNGREADLPNGVTVRLVAASNVTAADEARGVHRIEEIPDDEKEIARQLFGIESTAAVAAAAAAAKPVGRSWRDKYAGTSPGGDEIPVELQSDVDVEVGRTSFEGVAPEPLRSTPPPALSIRPPKDDVPAPSPAPSRTSDAGGPSETRTVSAGLAQTPLKAALPFQSAPAPAPVPVPVPATLPVSFGAVPFASALKKPEDRTHDFEKPAVSWKIPAGIGIVVLVMAAIYLAWRSEEPPAVTLPLPAAIETTAPPATAAPIPTPTPTAAPTPTPTVEATPTATATSKPSTKKTSPTRGPVVKPPKSNPVFDNSPLK
jgi:hypothetical protein